MNRPKVMNALNQATITELRAAFEDACDDSAVRGVILTGAGDKAFAAGADIAKIANETAVEAEEATRRGQALTDLIENLGKPVIAAVNGFALGGGCELAMACTIRIAAESAKFGQPEVKLGVMPGYGGTQRLPRLVGKGRALQTHPFRRNHRCSRGLSHWPGGRTSGGRNLIERAEAVSEKDHCQRSYWREVRA